MAPRHLAWVQGARLLILLVLLRHVVRLSCFFFPTAVADDAFPSSSLRSVSSTRRMLSTSLPSSPIPSCPLTSVIHFFFSWFSAPGILPDPFFRIFLKNGHRTKHGSDTGVYDPEGRFIPAKFEEIFTKFDKNGKGGLSFKEGLHMIHANRQAADPIGWCAEGFEWASTYLLSTSTFFPVFNLPFLLDSTRKLTSLYSPL